MARQTRVDGPASSRRHPRGQSAATMPTNVPNNGPSQGMPNTDMRRPRLYVATYHSRHRQPPENPSKTAAALYATAASDDFPYDGGDDPSLFAARHHDGPVTWGVCRADVRSAVRPDDWVAFFSKQDNQDGVTRYRFVAACASSGRLRIRRLQEAPSRTT